ncbi:hypothetical protein Poli38472_003153 [Pythium oligandrum]|uniref:Uncharacterized protein n=1 Tax=Pythium oligandrum TaxID=41045 RepID=A0A8K1C6A7_PYTOL|nr:hypothetical protein Poli38472_003153 [Pythium oligandrum]|eukprot:TMW57228.1 hypothetical protein Poli38472_003153 [Pythium oligandrum]
MARSKRREDEEADGGSSDSTAPSASAQTAYNASARRVTVFLPAHSLKFGLEVVAREEQTQDVTAVLCLFCKHFGREERVGAKRRATTNFKYFKPPFRTDQYLQHHRLQHPKRWAAYEAASVQEKHAFFPHHLASAMPMEQKKRLRYVKDENQVAGIQDMSIGRRLVIPASIVRAVKGDMRWEPLALTMCEIVTIARESDEDTEDETNAAPEKPIAPAYRVTIADRQSCDLVLDLCATGLSTQQITQSLSKMATRIDTIKTLGGVWNELVEEYIMFGCFATMTMVSQLLSDAQSFCLAFQSRRDVQGIERLEVRARFFHKILSDMHLLSVKTETVASMTTVIHLLSTLFPSWRRALLGVVIEGDLSDNHVEVLTTGIARLSAEVSHPVIRVWNGSSLLLHALTELTNRLMNGRFASTLWMLKAYISTRVDLLQEIGHPQELEPFEASKTMEAVALARWLTEKRIRVRKYLEDTRPSCQPSDVWWLVLAVFDWLASHARESLKKLRTPHHGGLLGHLQQHELLTDLVTDCRCAFRVELQSGVDTALSSRDDAFLSTSQAFVVKREDLLEFTTELGTFASTLVEDMSTDELSTGTGAIGTAVVEFVETLSKGLSNAIQLVGAISEAEVQQTPPILPHDLVKLSSKEFAALFARYRPQLAVYYSDEQFDALDQEHQFLKRSSRERDFKNLFGDAATNQWSFDQCWGMTQGRFRLVHTFAGQLAALYHSSVSVEAEKSLRGHWTRVHEPFGQREGVDLPVEAPLYAAQFHRLEQLCEAVDV